MDSLTFQKCFQPKQYSEVILQIRLPLDIVHYPMHLKSSTSTKTLAPTLTSGAAWVSVFFWMIFVFFVLIESPNQKFVLCYKDIQTKICF